MGIWNTSMLNTFTVSGILFVFVPILLSLWQIPWGQTFQLTKFNTFFYTLLFLLLSTCLVLFYFYFFLISVLCSLLHQDFSDSFQILHAGRALRILRLAKLLSLVRLLRLSRLVRYVSQWEEVYVSTIDATASI